MASFMAPDLNKTASSPQGIPLGHDPTFSTSASAPLIDIKTRGITRLDQQKTLRGTALLIRFCGAFEGNRVDPAQV
jgi:hypothetical protein